MTDNKNNPAEGQDTQQGDKTFTQDDLNRIVTKRLAEDRAKGEQELRQKQQELDMRELRITAHEVLQQKGLPVDIIDALNCKDKDTMQKSIDFIDKLIQDKIKEKAAPLQITGAKPAAAPAYNGMDRRPTGDPIRAAMGLGK